MAINASVTSQYAFTMQAFKNLLLEIPIMQYTLINNNYHGSVQK